MADWNQPIITSTYADVINGLRARDEDSAKLFSADPTNPIVGMVRYNRTSDKFQEYRTTPAPGWYDLVLSAAGGGTGGTAALGSMAFQSAGSIAVTGGTLSGITSLTMAGNILFDADGTRNVGSNANKINNVYIKNGLVVPVGVDKWVSA